MNMLEAAKKSLDSDFKLWFRPMSAKGLGYAYVFDWGRRRVFTVPSSRGGDPAPFPKASELFEEWEAVDSLDVCERR